MTSLTCPRPQCAAPNPLSATHCRECGCLLGVDTPKAQRKRHREKRRQEAKTLVKEMLVERPRRIYQACGYCGHPAHGRACTAHRDLLPLDPNTIARGGAAA